MSLHYSFLARLRARRTDDDPALERGAAAVEFAVIAPVFVLLLVSVAGLGDLFALRNTLQHAAEEAGRYAMAEADATQKQIEDVFRTAFAKVRSTPVTVAVTYDTASGVNFVTITGSYQSVWDLGGYRIGPVVLQGRSRVPLAS
ncbi:MAG TPA: TadE/TadG family type IV pilus assembly protein [Azospirillum sp.]|nr:TadE/TadG family type IV pilus assembly protein [Azospirillum sp.]